MARGAARTTGRTAGSRGRPTIDLADPTDLPFGHTARRRGDRPPPQPPRVHRRPAHPRPTLLPARPHPGGHRHRHGRFRRADPALPRRPLRRRPLPARDLPRRAARRRPRRPASTATCRNVTSCWSLRKIPKSAASSAKPATATPPSASAAVVFIWAAVPYRSEWKYGCIAHKMIAIEAGHVCQNLYLAAESIDAGTCAMLGYHQPALDELIGVDGE